MRARVYREYTLNSLVHKMYLFKLAPTNYVINVFLNSTNYEVRNDSNCIGVIYPYI